MAKLIDGKWWVGAAVPRTPQQLRGAALEKSAEETLTKSGRPTRAEAENALVCLGVIMREQRAARKGAKVDATDELLQALEMLKARATAQTRNKAAAAKAKRPAPLRAVATPDTTKGAVRGAALRGLEEKLAKARTLHPRSSEYKAVITALTSGIEREYKAAQADIAKAATASDAAAPRAHMAAIKSLLTRTSALPAPGGAARLARFPGTPPVNPKLAKLRSERDDLKKRVEQSGDPILIQGWNARLLKVEDKIEKLESGD